MTTSEAQKRANAKYRQKDEIKTNYAKYVKERFKTIAACYKRAEGEYIAEILSAHHITPAEVIRGATAALLDGQPIRTEAEPLPIPAADVETTDQSDGNDPTDPRED